MQTDPGSYCPLQPSEANATAITQTCSTINSCINIGFLSPVLCHVSPNKTTAGNAETGFVSRPAVNSVFLLPFWAALCSLLILLPSSCWLQKTCTWKALSLPTSYAQDMVGMELIFSLAARMVLCFGFVASSVLITHQCSSFCWTVLAEH